MRAFVGFGVSAVALLLVMGSRPGDETRLDRGGAEPREETSAEPGRLLPESLDRTLPAWPVRTPVHSLRIPSMLASGADPLPTWLDPNALEVAPSGPPVAPLLSAATDALPARMAAQQQALEPYEFYFTRAIYSSGGGWGRRGQAWATDFPKADRQFMVVLQRLTSLDNYPYENAVSLADPNIRNYPFLYMLEVGNMRLTQSEVVGLREYLQAGGFLMVDDFWGQNEWRVFEYFMRQALPGRPIQEVPADHPLFNLVYDIDEVLQVPARGRGVFGRPTWERTDAQVPTVTGIFDDFGRLMAVVNWNTDLGDAWEWAEDPIYPVEFSTYAFQVGVNTIVYGMSH